MNTFADTYVMVKCVLCGDTKKVYAGETEQPMCSSCYMPMIPEIAKIDK